MSIKEFDANHEPIRDAVCGFRYRYVCLLKTMCYLPQSVSQVKQETKSTKSRFSAIDDCARRVYAGHSVPTRHHVHFGCQPIFTLYVGRAMYECDITGHQSCRPWILAITTTTQSCMCFILDCLNNLNGYFYEFVLGFARARERIILQIAGSERAGYLHARLYCLTAAVFA